MNTNPETPTTATGADFANLNQAAQTDQGNVGDQEAQDPIAALNEVQSKYAEMSEAYLRAKAEVENIRRRSEEEMSKARKFAVENFANSLLPVKDSLEAAVAIESGSAEQVLQGVHATLRQLQSALESNKVVEINPASAEKFDPNIHQAISVVPADQEPNTVVMVLQKGYRIFDRVLRPALVTVTAPK